VSVKNMNQLTCAIAVLLVAVPVLGKPTQKANLAFEIQKATQTKFGYEVSIRVKNISSVPIVLGRTGAAPSKLQSLDIQQWDEKLGWQSVGPCRDVPAIAALTLAPGQELEDVVPIGDLEHGWSSTVCPIKITRLGGRIRAVIYCTYKSEKEYEKPLRCKDCCTPITSPEFNLPRLAK
jgi:hypothetical protein